MQIQMIPTSNFRSNDNTNTSNTKRQEEKQEQHQQQTYTASFTKLALHMPDTHHI